MAFGVDTKKIAENTGDFKRETLPIPAGLNQARLAAYIELGMHPAIFKGKPAVTDKGAIKDDEFIIHLIFEFPAAEKTTDYPQTIKTSVPFGEGEFMNKLAVTSSLFNGTLSPAYANRSKFMKYLNAMNDACGTSYESLSDFVNKPFNIPVYSNMLPEGIQSVDFKNPITGKMETAEVPEVQGNYTNFDWDAPTEDAWNNLPKFLKDRIQKATNYEGSEVQAMVAGLPVEPEEEVKGAPTENCGTPAVTDDVPV